MNYIKHTVAAHEHLRTRPATTLHIALYWALFFQWNAHYFDGGIDLDHEAAMQAARIGNRKTYRATLYDLDAWGLLTYQPSKSRHHPSRCLLTDLSGAKVPQVKPPTKGSSAPNEKSLPGAEVPQALRAEVPPIAALPGAVMPQASLVVQTSLQTPTTNSSGSTQKKIGEVFAGEGLSEVRVLDDNRWSASANASLHSEQTASGAAPKDFAPPANRVAPKSKGVGQGPPLASTAEPRRRGGRPPRLEVPFAESELATYEAFAAAFAGTNYQLADLRFYHEKILNWRQKGELPRRRDWKATATQFFLNDAHDNRLKLAPGTQRHEPGTGPGTAPDNAGGPAPGYRSSRWD